jgi:hypothetical protein
MVELTSNYLYLIIKDMTETPERYQVRELNRYDGIMNVWEKAWEPGRGPNFTAARYHSPAFEHLSPESQAAETPEREAYQNIINTVAADMLAAFTTTGNPTEVIANFTEALPTEELSPADILAFVNEVLAAGFKLIEEAQTTTPR